MASLTRRLARPGLVVLFALMVAGSAAANDLWVAPTYQQDIGGLGIGSSFFWPTTPFGAARLAWGVPGDLQAFKNARVAIIPDAPGGAAALLVYVCAAAAGDLVNAACTGPFAHAYVGVPNQLIEVDISVDIAPQIGTPGQNHLAVFAYSAPTTATDHLVGLRFVYETAPPIVTSGNLTLPATTSASNGVLQWGGSRFLHEFGAANAFLGGNAGNFTMTGVENVAVGETTLQANQTGSWNTALGSRALFANTTGFSNTGAGYSALGSNTTGTSNTATGDVALGSNVGGESNSAFGVMTLLNNTEGDSNTAAGQEALRDTTTGNSNTAVGVQALSHTTTSSFNTALGVRAGTTSNLANANVTGFSNTFIGAFSGPGAPTPLTNAAAIGANALVTASNALVLGSSVVSVGIGTTAPLAKLQVAGNVRVGTGTTGCVQDNDGTVIAGTCSSDARLKRNVEPFGAMADRVARLQPVYFDWKADDYPDLHFGSARSFGLIAQEVEDVLPELVTEDERGLKAVRYSQLPLILLQALKDQQAQIQQLVAEIAALKDRLP